MTQWAKPRPPGSREDSCPLGSLSAPLRPAARRANQYLFQARRFGRAKARSSKVTTSLAHRNRVLRSRCDPKQSLSECGGSFRRDRHTATDSLDDPARLTPSSHHDGLSGCHEVDQFRRDEVCKRRVTRKWNEKRVARGEQRSHLLERDLRVEVDVREPSGRGASGDRVPHRAVTDEREVNLVAGELRGVEDTW